MNHHASKRQLITHEELARAIAAFQTQGGMVVQLPPEKVPRPRLVGRRWSRFEEVIPYGGGPADEMAV